MASTPQVLPARANVFEVRGEDWQESNAGQSKWSHPDEGGEPAPSFWDSNKNFIPANCLKLQTDPLRDATIAHNIPTLPENVEWNWTNSI